MASRHLRARRPGGRTKFRISSERFENIGKFMRVVTNSQPLGIVAVSGDTTYTFANEPAARDAEHHARRT